MTKPKGLSPERIAALQQRAAKVLNTPDADLSGVVESYQQSHCLCCGLAISEKMLARSATRAKNSSRKPVYTIPGGRYEGRLLCKPCVNSGAGLAELSLASHTNDEILQQFRAKVIQNFSNIFSASQNHKALHDALDQLNFGNWHDHMRAPDSAQLFWVLIAAMQKAKESRK